MPKQVTTCKVLLAQVVDDCISLGIRHQGDHAPPPACARESARQRPRLLGQPDEGVQLLTAALVQLPSMPPPTRS